MEARSRFASRERRLRSDAPRKRLRSRIDFGGLNRIPGMLAELLENSAGPVSEAVTRAVS